MRKVLSFVLVLSLVLGSLGMAFADFSDMADESSAEAVDVLTGLGVISGYTDGTFRPDKVVTRAEMAKLIVAALGVEKFATATTSKFTDMASAAWAQGYVAYGTSLGFITGYPDGTFKPNKTVTYEEACSMILRALGYTSEFLPGDWPAEWVIKAKTLGILDGITFGSSIGANRGDIAEMLYNSLDLYIGYINKDGDWAPFGADEKKYDTMLVRLGAKLVEADDLEDGVIYGDEKSVINLRPFVGAYADRYLNKDDKIIKVVPISEFLEGEFTSATVFETADGVEYKLKASVSAEAPFFVNGAYKTIAKKTDLVNYPSNIDETGILAVEIDGKYISEIYSVHYWEVKDEFLVDKDVLEELKEDDTLHGSEFVLTSKDEIDMDSFELVGIDELEDLEKDNVVYVYTDKNNEIRKIAVGTKVVEGEVTKIASNGKITVDGKVYSKSSAAPYDDSDLVWNDIDIEDEVILYLDYAGKVYKAELLEGSSSKDYAIILKTEKAGEGDITGKDALVELFLADGTSKVFDVKTDVSLYDKGTKETPKNEWKTTAKAGTLVKYAVNDKGVVKTLDLVTDLKEVNTKTKVTDKGYFDGKSVLADVLIFTYDGVETADNSDWADDDNYGVMTLAKVKGNEYDNVDYVLNDSNKITVMYIFGEGDSSDEVYGLLTDTFKSKASDSGYVATVLVDGAEVEYEVTEDVYNLSASQALYMLKFNGKGQISSLVKVTKDSAGDAKLLDEGVLDETLSGGILTVKVGGVNKEYTMDSSAIAYKWDDDVYVKSSASRANLKKDVYVLVYDLDKDKVADIVLFGNTPL